MLRPACALLLLAASALGHLDQAALDSQWEEWKVTHKREYNGLVSVWACVLRACVCVCVSKHFLRKTFSTDGKKERKWRKNEDDMKKKVIKRRQMDMMLRKMCL